MELFFDRGIPIMDTREKPPASQKIGLKGGPRFFPRKPELHINPAAGD